MKKGIKLGAAVVLSLCLCWFVGQQLKQARETKQEQNASAGQEQNGEEGREDGLQEAQPGAWSLAEHMDNVVVNGLAESGDYPYGYNVGAIEDDEVGQAILLTPDTSIVLEGMLSGEAVLEIEYQIHPWVAADSDGAILNLDVTSAEETQKYTYEVSDTMQNQTLSLSRFAGQEIRMEISVSNEEGNNESCDWVILKRFAFPEGSFTGKEIEVGETADFKSGHSEVPYARSATYFGDEWPLNFWNSEMASLDRDMEQIQEDGFDSIILVIPWREFQPETAPVVYNETAFQKLDQVMEAAARAELGVYARIGYLWDYYGDQEEDIKERFFRLMGGGVEEEAWYDYMARMYAALSAHENFREGFLTWEDFWNNLDICDEITGEGWLKEDGRSIEELRLEKAADTGYQKWVEAHDTLEEYNQNYGTSYKAYTDIPIPGRTEPAMEAMYAFFDDFLNTILKDSQKEFPNLSMEVRVDWDVVSGKDGEMKYHRHSSTYSCQGSSFTAVMYGIPMGFENVGEKVGFQEAMEKTAYILGQLKQENGGKPVYIDQFIFADNTPRYSRNAQIKEDELDDYLENIHDVLLEYSEGYGIWAYRNYRTNMLYNSQFALGGDGWNPAGSAGFETGWNPAGNADFGTAGGSAGDAGFEAEGASAVCRLAQGGSIRQIVPMIRNHFDHEEYILEMDIATVEAAGKLRISVGEESRTADITEKGKLRLTFPKNSSFDLEIASEGCGVSIDNVRLYPYVHQGYLYNEENEELQCVKAVRELNRNLEQRTQE